MDDGRVSRAEKAELTATAALLDVPAGAVTAVLDAAQTARHARLSAGLHPLPADWRLGAPLRVGDKVAFTGCEDAIREALEQRAQQLGVRVMDNVSQLSSMLVTDGSFAGGKAADAAALGVRCVHPNEFAVLLRHLQPAARLSPATTPRPSVTPTPTSLAAPAPQVARDASPAAVRAWAREQGYDVGERGRLPAEVTAAYHRAHQATSR